MCVSERRRSQDATTSEEGVFALGPDERHALVSVRAGARWHAVDARACPEVVSLCRAPMETCMCGDLCVVDVHVGGAVGFVLWWLVGCSSF